jgi:sugar phosphate isomerase/epimerase
MQAAGAGIGLATASHALLGKNRVKLNIGVSAYSYHNLSFDEMVAQLTALQIKEIEMSRGEFMLMNHPDERLFRLARVKLERVGIRCVSYYSATIQEEDDLYRAARFAKILGVKHVSGDATGVMLSRIDHLFTDMKLTFGIHNHYFKGEKFAYESPDNVLAALSMVSGTVGSTADVGHFASCGYDPVGAIRKLAGRLQLVHLKDVEAAQGETNVLLGKGVARIPEVMEELRRQEFNGLVAIEYEKEGRVEEDMRRDVGIARGLA